jgi:ADP-heptose synthase, bifunctional sugar kinase/adenylyltransferase
MAAKNFGDVLVLGINTDESIRQIKGIGRPFVPQAERGGILSAMESVDYVVFFEENTPIKLIEQIKPAIIVKGGNYLPEQVIGYEQVKQYGGRIEVVPIAKTNNLTGLPKGIDE